MSLIRKKTNRTLKILTGSFLFLISAPCVIGMIYDLITGADNLGGAVVAGTFFGILGLFGAYLLVKGFRTPQEGELLIDGNLEREVLYRARVHQGVLTVPRLAMETSLTLADAEVLLSELHRQGYAQADLSSEGVLEYHFPDLAPQMVLDDLERAIEDAHDATHEATKEQRAYKEE